MPLRRGLASTGIRLALMQAVILIGAFQAAGWLVGIATRQVMHRDAEAHVAAEAAALSDEYGAGGRTRLAASITLRSRRTDGVYYRLSRADGAHLAGELPQAPSATGWSFIDGDSAPPSANPASNQDIVVYARHLTNGDTLAVGEAMGAREQLRSQLLHSLFWCGLIAAVGGLGASLFVYGGVVRRVDGVVEAAREASLGRLDARAPVRHAFVPDDIDALAQAFNHMLAQINGLLQSIRQVSADIAHDLRTPLTRVRQKLDLLQRARASDPQLTESIGSINADIDETLRAFDAMLRLAEIESSRAIALQPVDLAAVALRVADAYRPDAEESGRQIDACLRPAGVMGDAELLTHAVANLLDNALKHTPEGTRIFLETGQGDGHPWLSVSDDGPGVPELHRAAVLERFFRLERSRTTAGSGLGLAIVAAIASRHRARLELLDAGPGLRVRLMFQSPIATAPSRIERRHWFTRSPRPNPLVSTEISL
ncbi:MAG: sensory histidine protein kinase [Caulobacteraceae bacterium]|nr:sensory histidine protein kinase [Caulobacteraceae bacterium]